MKKIIKFMLCIVLVGAIFGTIGVWKDKQFLQDTLFRLNVADNLDFDGVQQLKNAIAEYLKPITEKFPTKEQAMDYIHNTLPALETFSNGILDALGVKDREKVTVQPQAFGTRDFKTFLF